MAAQVQKTYLYELTLYEQFRHRSMWGEREHHIQKEHIAYLETLTETNELEIAGIIGQGFEDHIGIIILTTENYEEAKSIALNDPAVKKGMMSARLRPISIYFAKMDK